MMDIFLNLNQSENILSFLDEFSSSSSFAGEGFLKSFNKINLSGSFTGLFFITFCLIFTPNVLDSQCFSFIFKSKSMVFKGLDCSGDGFLIGYNGIFKVGLTFNESLVFVLKVLALSNPIGSLSLFSVLEEVSGLNELLSNLTEEIKDLDDGLVINLGSKLSEGTDQGLEEGVFTFSKFSLDLFKSALDLGESNTSLKVLNDLGSFINSFNLVNVLSILFNPGLVLLSTEGIFRSIAIFVLFNILGDLSNFLFSFFKGFNGILSELGGGNNLALVISNLLFHISDELFASSFIVFIDSVSRGLLLVKSAGHVLKKKVNLVNRGTSCSCKLNH